MRARVDRVDRTLELTVGIEYRRLPRRGGEVDAERGRVERAPILERGRREVRHDVGAALRHASASLFGAVAGGDDGGVLLRGEPGRVAEREHNRLRRLGVRRREGDVYNESRQEHGAYE